MSGHCCSPAREASQPGSVPVSTSGPGAGTSRFVEVPGGTFLMGTDDAVAHPLDGEGPVREVEVAAFAISPTAVTIAEFSRFVDATGHVTDAERFGDSLVFDGLVPAGAAPAPTVATAPWWRQVAGADWRRPEGPGSDVDDRLDHPVTHVSHADAVAYTQWAGTRLPTEVEWERAARGGLEQQPFPWGAEREPGGEVRMKIFTGDFPDGPAVPVGTVPVDAFEPNAFGLFNTTGNVWEWTSSPWSGRDPRPVLRGGSYLCHDSYCLRYRTSARTANTPDTSLGHTGFRVAAR